MLPVILLWFHTIQVTQQHGAAFAPFGSLDRLGKQQKLNFINYSRIYLLFHVSMTVVKKVKLQSQPLNKNIQ